jgi:hypothetical protein
MDVEAILAAPDSSDDDIDTYNVNLEDILNESDE